MQRKIWLHYLVLTITIALGVLLRFWNLDIKPLWQDEVITALFSLGRSYDDIPLEVIFPLSKLAQIFTLNPQISCPQIAHIVATQSTHPPLFFCLLHGWLVWLNQFQLSLAWKLRSLSALFGVAAILAVYYLNRLTFSVNAGLIAAALMAVSPFAVYLSQEARHYTLPIFLITLALLLLIQMQQDLRDRQQLRPFIWVTWIAINSFGLYIHYFFIIALIAQISTMIGTIKSPNFPGQLKLWFSPLNLKLGYLLLLPIAIFIPWLAQFQNTSSRSVNDWLKLVNPIAPLYQTLASWVIMVVTLPVEKQPIWIKVPAGLLMIIFAIWFGRQVYQGLQKIWRNSADNLAVKTLHNFILFIWLEFGGIIYLFGQDLTLAPRYNFVYYPGMCSLIGASLAHKNLQKLLIIILVGIISCIFVGTDLVFKKPFHPQEVATDINRERSLPVVTVVGYNNLQGVALGISFALEVYKDNPTVSFSFLYRTKGYQSVWEKLEQMPPIAAPALNLWIVAPSLPKSEYPSQLWFSELMSCHRDDSEYHNVGISYQLYHCFLREN